MQVISEATAAGVSIDAAEDGEWMHVNHGSALISFHPTARFGYLFDVVKIEDRQEDGRRRIILWHGDGSFTNLSIIE